MNTSIDPHSVLKQVLNVIVPDAQGYELLSTRNHIVARVTRHRESAVIVKLAIERRVSTLSRECRVIRLLQSHVPVPELLTPDPQPVLDTKEYIVMLDAGGQSVFEMIKRQCSERHALLDQMGQFLRRLHGLPADATVSECLTTVDDAMRFERLTQIARTVQRNGELPRRLVDDFLNGPTPTLTADAICHGDYHAVQCIAVGDTLQVVVDWHSARIGDRRADYAVSRTNLAMYCGDDELCAFDQGYFREAAMPADWHPVVRTVTLSQCLALMDALRVASGTERESPWFRRAARLFRQLA